MPLRLNIGDLPGNLVWGQLSGGAAVAGAGFTVPASRCRLHGAGGMPTFFINGTRYEGEHTVATMSEAINEALIAAGSTGK